MYLRLLLKDKISTTLAAVLVTRHVSTNFKRTVIYQFCAPLFCSGNCQLLEKKTIITYHIISITGDIRSKWRSGIPTRNHDNRRGKWKRRNQPAWGNFYSKVIIHDLLTRNSREYILALRHQVQFYVTKRTNILRLRRRHYDRGIGKMITSTIKAGLLLFKQYMCIDILKYINLF